MLRATLGALSGGAKGGPSPEPTRRLDDQHKLERAAHPLIKATERAAANGVPLADLRAFCARYGVPPPGAVQSAWDEWDASLSRWSQQLPLVPALQDRRRVSLSMRCCKALDGGCEIVETALRGITLNQLRLIYAKAREMCRKKKWKTYDVASKSWTGALIDPDELNLYELVHYWVEPQTAARKCSMVELVADGAQPPRFFVSHWWGEGVKDFIACIAQHVKDHSHLGVDANTPYWVCAYANNQHSIGSELNGGVMASSFVRALHLSDGMVTVTDKEGVVLSRVWCALEAYVATLQRGPEFTHDIYTAGKFCDMDNKPCDAVGLVSGFAEADIIDGVVDTAWKAFREAAFPPQLAEVAARFDVANTEASEKADKEAIMAEVGGDAHKLNATVRARYSIGLLPALLEGGDLQRLAAYCAALRMSKLRSISLYCEEGKASAQTVQQVVDALPASLVELSAEGIGPGAVGGIAVRIEQGQLLRLSLRSCRLGAAEGSALAAALGASSARLRELDLMNNVMGDEGASVLAKCLERNTSLTSLNLETNGVRAEGASALAKCLELNTSLTSLDLMLNDVGAEAESALLAAWGARGQLWV